MKSKNQENSSTQVLEVEHLSITTVDGRKVLIIKPRNEKSVAYRLPTDFIQKVIQSQESNKS